MRGVVAVEEEGLPTQEFLTCLAHLRPQLDPCPMHPTSLSRRLRLTWMRQCQKFLKIKRLQLETCHPSKIPTASFRVRSVLAVSRPNLTLPGTHDEIMKVAQIFWAQKWWSTYIACPDGCAEDACALAPTARIIVMNALQTGAIAKSMETQRR